MNHANEHVILLDRCIRSPSRAAAVDTTTTHKSNRGPRPPWPGLLQIPVRWAPPIFIHDIGQRNTANRAESSHW
jgi:hypothetical protein